MTMARILVHLDTRPGLEEKITLHHCHVSRKQALDYEGVPFRCRRCHKIGHLYKDCPLNSGVTSEDTKGPRQQPSVDQNIGVNISTEGVQTQHEPPSKQASDGAKKNSRRQASSTPGPPRTRSKTAATNPAHPGNDSFPSCSLYNSDALQSAFQSSLRSPSTVHIPLPSIPCTIGPSPPTFSTNPSSHKLDLGLPKSSSSPVGSGSHPYHLRPRARPRLLGLGSSPGRFRKPKRGRPSKIYSAKQNAVADVAQGRQYTIERALRAIEPLTCGSP